MDSVTAEPPRCISMRCWPPRLSKRHRRARRRPCGAGLGANKPTSDTITSEIIPPRMSAVHKVNRLVGERLRKEADQDAIETERHDAIYDADDPGGV